VVATVGSGGGGPSGDGDVDVFDCSLCYNPMHDPTTTPCQHAFCGECLRRCLDHRPECPLCRAKLTTLLASRHIAVNWSLYCLVRTAFPAAYAERASAVASERAAAEMQIPIFVCNEVLPRAACGLHVFEPRYRLMMRRAAAGNGMFGMATHMPGGGFSRYGTRVVMRRMKPLPDGRMLVDSVGERRFRVDTHEVRDDYVVGHISWVLDTDAPPAGGAAHEAYWGHPMPLPGGLAITTRAAFDRVLTWVSDLRRLLRRLVAAPPAGEEGEMGAVYLGAQSLGDDLAAADLPDPDTDADGYLWGVMGMLPTSHDWRMRAIASTSWRERLAAVLDMLAAVGSPGTLALRIGARLRTRALMSGAIPFPPALAAHLQAGGECAVM